MPGKHPKVRVLNPGGVSRDDWNVAGAVVEHDRLPGWRFRVSLSLRDGRVLGLAIDPVSSEAFETGITTRDFLRVLPLGEIVAAIRAANAAQLLDWTSARRFQVHEIDDSGQTVAVRAAELTPTLVMRQAIREIAEPIRRNPKSRPRTKRLTDRRLAEEMLAFSTAIAAGGSVAQFVRDAQVNPDTFRDHRELAIGRGLFTSFGRGRPGGSLTSAGERALRDKE